jgi:hypothetical protein
MAATKPPPGMRKPAPPPAPPEPICEHRYCRCERAVELVEQGRSDAAKAVGHQKVRCRQAGEGS